MRFHFRLFRSIKAQKSGNDFPLNGSIERDQVSRWHLAGCNRPVKNQSIGKIQNRQRQAECISKYHDFKEIFGVIQRGENAFVHAFFLQGRSKRPHTEFLSRKKCRSAMIFNKRSLNFILVFLEYFLQIIFSLVFFFLSLLVIAIKETFHSTFFTFCFVGQSAIRIDMWLFSGKH